MRGTYKARENPLGGGFTMKRLCFALLALVAVALATVGAASAARGAGPFATGSGKADVFAGEEHLAFTAHNGALPFGPSCAATGQLNYTSPTQDFKADVTGMGIIPAAGGGGTAFISATVTKSANPPVPFVTPGVGDSVFFDVTDSNQHPDGTGDSLLFEATLPGSQTLCLNGLAGHPLTSGNIIVKADELLP